MELRPGALPRFSWRKCYGIGTSFAVCKTYEYVLFSIFFAESLTAMHPGGSEVEGPF